MATPAPLSLDEELKRMELEASKIDLKHKRLEPWVKILGAVAVLFGIILPVVQYTSTLEREQADRKARQGQEEEQKKKEIEAALREARRPFLERQQELYFEATIVAAKLATLEDSTERRAARNRFEQLYWGELSVVEDKLVEAAMVEFRQTLTVFENEPINSRETLREELKRQTLKLAHGCRDSLARGWGYDRGVINVN